jgi:apolipoprotein N-acyltransferase
VPVRIVQGNNELRTQWRREFYGDGLERYLALSQTSRSRSPRVLIWPESAVTFFLGEEPAHRGRIGRVLGVLGAELVVGAPSRQPRGADAWQSYNSAFLVDEDGAVRARYDKRRLLPFAEYFPLRFLAFLRRHFDAVRDFTSGETPLLLETRAGQAAVVICFEAIFPELVAERMRLGAEILINLSNDIWLGSWAGPAQHLQMVVLRAVENRVWVLRATTTGVSAAIDPLGRVRVRSRFGTTATLDQEVSPMRVWTVYKQFGDVLAFVCVAMTALTLIALRRRDARR